MASSFYRDTQSLKMTINTCILQSTSMFIYTYNHFFNHFLKNKNVERLTNDNGKCTEIMAQSRLRTLTGPEGETP